MADEPADPPRWRPRTRGKRVALAIWTGVATFAALLVLDGFVAGRSLVSNLTRARSELNVAIEAIVTGDPEGARPHFLAAEEAADRAIAAAGHPSMGIAGLLPLAGDNLDAAAAVAAASKETALAGHSLVEVARELGWTDVGLPGSSAAGSLDVGALEAAGTRMDPVVQRLGTALSELEEAGGGGLLGPVATGYRDAVEHLARRADLAAHFRDAALLASAMFGEEAPQRYLLCVPTLGVPEPGGGAPAAVGVLLAQGGVLEIEPVQAGQEGLVPAPGTVADVPGSPDWPTTARRLLEAFALEGGSSLDGVILLDPVALQDLVWVSGDVRVEDRTLPLNDATTVSALEIDAFLGSDPEKAARLHASWVSRIVERFLDRRPGLESFALAVARDAREGRIAIYLSDRSDRSLVRRLGLDRRAPAPEEGVLPVLAAWSATEPSHVGALVDPRIRLEVSLRDDGSATVRAEVSIVNGAGVDPPSVLLGSFDGNVPVGTFAGKVSLYLPADARQVEAETSRPTPIEVVDDLGYSVVTGSLTIRGGDTATLTVSYVVDQVAIRTDGERSLVLRLVPQPTIDGLAYQIRVALPDGATFSSISPGVQRRGSTAVFSGTRAGPEDLEFVYVR
jgi:Protein of unknown function (DUF4012)